MYRLKYVINETFKSLSILQLEYNKNSKGLTFRSRRIFVKEETTPVCTQSGDCKVTTFLWHYLVEGYINVLDLHIVGSLLTKTKERQENREGRVLNLVCPT